MTPAPPSRARPRLYLPELPHPRLAERPCLIDPEQTRHLRKVLRCREGDALELFDGQGGLAQAVIAGFEGSRAACRVEHVDHYPPLEPHVTVAAAVPKGSRPDDMVEQLSQVGADRFVPIQTQRSVVDPRPHKLERLQRVAVEAAKQCGRLHVLEIEPMVSFSEVLKRSMDLHLIAATGGKVATLGKRLQSAGSVQVLIGPEGGWTPEELSAAEAAGAVRWSLGPFVMRIETAAPTAVGVLRYLTMGG